MDLEIIKIASNTENNKILKHHTHSSKMKNSICGDEMEISIVVKDKKITDFGYQCKSCIYCQASVSALSINSLNQSVKSIKDLLFFAENFFINNKKKFSKNFNIFNKLFNKKNIARKECLLLPFKTLSKALKDYDE